MFDETHLETMTGVAAVVGLALANAFDFQRMRAQAAMLRTALDQDRPMIGESKAMKKIYDIIARVAPAKPRCCCWGKAEQEKRWPRALCIAIAAALRNLLLPSTAQRWATIFWKASYSATKKGRLRGPWV